MKRLFVILAFFVLLALLIAGCGDVVTCPPEYLIAPSLVSPANWTLVDSLSPTLSWTFPSISYPYPYPGNTCIPELYRVKVMKGPFFIENFNFDVAGPLTSTTLSDGLLPATEYAWSVQPFSTGSGGSLEAGMVAGDRYFFTGPVCDAEVLIAPTLLQPYNGASIAMNYPSLVWEYGDATCRPEGYVIELDTSPEFTSTALNGATGNPSTRWGPGTSLTECTTYYWRVKPVVGDTLGPASEVFSFSVNIGGSACTNRTFIEGNVWEEYCAIPDGPTPATPPIGCVLTEGGGVTGNGIWDPGEPGIANVMVRIGSGSCPSSNLGVTFTDQDGEYLFQGLEPGTYCLSVNVMDNTSVLIPGGFTYPAGVESDLAYQEVTIGEDDLVKNNDFGWMYQFGPSTVIGEIKGTLFHDKCRKTGETVDVGDAPSGCIRYYDGKVHGDGIFTADENGIANVWVGISTNYCTNEPFAWSKTDENGEFHFIVPAGTDIHAKEYCLSIDAAGGSNMTILGDGVWSAPWMYYETKAKRNVALSANETEEGWDFGWDYTNLPLEFSEIPIFEYPKFHIDLDTNCRVGPEIRWQSIAILKAGMEFEVEGLLMNGNWVLLTPAKILNKEQVLDGDLSQITTQCWVLVKNGSIIGDTSQVPRQESPEPPTYTPTVTPSPTPTPVSVCPTYTMILQCQADSRCRWTNDKVRVGNYCVAR